MSDDPTFRIQIRLTDLEAEELIRAAIELVGDIDYVRTFDSRARRRALERAIRKIQDRVTAGRIRGTIPVREKSPRQ